MLAERLVHDAQRNATILLRAVLERQGAARGVVQGLEMLPCHLVAQDQARGLWHERHQLLDVTSLRRSLDICGSRGNVSPAEEALQAARQGAHPLYRRTAREP